MITPTIEPTRLGNFAGTEIQPVAKAFSFRCRFQSHSYRSGPEAHSSLLDDLGNNDHWPGSDLLAPRLLLRRDATDGHPQYRRHDHRADHVVRDPVLILPRQRMAVPTRKVTGFGGLSTFHQAAAGVPQSTDRCGVVTRIRERRSTAKKIARPPRGSRAWDVFRSDHHDVIPPPASFWRPPCRWPE